MKYQCIFCQKTVEENIGHEYNCSVKDLPRETQEMLTGVISIAVKAVYFDDGSDYLSSLNSIIFKISPEIYEQLQDKSSLAFARVTREGHEYE